MGSNYIKTSQMKKQNENIGTKKVQNLQKMQQEIYMKQQEVAVVTTEVEASNDPENENVGYPSSRTPKNKLSQQFSNLESRRKMTRNNP